MTIASGYGQAGKTHLAINLALEFVRRGRQTGLFHDYEGFASMNALLSLPQPAAMQRRATDNQENRIIREGYQGVDILSCVSPLSQWTALDDEQLAQVVNAMDVEEGYDEFLVDTSGMDPHTLIACCKASPVVILMLTPDVQSQTETFALLQVLHLNGFDGELRLIVNKVPYVADAEEICRKFCSEVKVHLGLELPVLGVLVNSEEVHRAQRAGQAFTSIFPDAEVSGCVVVIADGVDGTPPQRVSGQKKLSVFLDAVINARRLPVRLAGGAVMEEPEVLYETSPVAVQDTARLTDSDIALLQFEGELSELHGALENTPAALQKLATGIAEFTDSLRGSNPVTSREIEYLLENDQLTEVAALLARAIDTLDTRDRNVQFNVEDITVSTTERGWLQPGDYLKYVLRLPVCDAVQAHLKALLLDIPAIQEHAGTEGETIWETVSPGRDGCLSVISDPEEGMRIQVWLAVNPRLLVSEDFRVLPVEKTVR
jgi:MinD-like ATPase involved in chromosome partitioning or flagellar assembly